MTDGVDVTPDDLRASGESIVGVRDGVMESPGFENVREQGQHYMMNDAGRLSGGFFEMSLWADEMMYQRSQELLMAHRDIIQNMDALASALHIVADVYEGGDVADAIDFAFVQTDTPPDGLPGYIDPDRTLQGEREQTEAEQREEEENGEEPPGGSGSGSGSGSGDSGETQVPIYSQYPYPYTVVGYEIYEDGELVRMEYHDHHEDGTYTVTTYENGEQTDETTYAPGLGDALEGLSIEQRGVMERELRLAGFDPADLDPT